MIMITIKHNNNNNNTKDNTNNHDENTTNTNKQYSTNNIYLVETQANSKTNNKHNDELTNMISGRRAAGAAGRLTGWKTDRRV